MSNFTPLVIKKFKFQDDEVKVTFRRLKRKHMMKLMPTIMEFKESFGEDFNFDSAPIETKLKLVTIITEDIGDKAAEYITNVEGLVDSNNEPVSMEELIENSYFFELFTEIVMAVVEASMGATGKK